MAKTKLMLKNELFCSLNLKVYKDLNTNLKCFVKEIFPKIENNDIIKCDIYNGSKIDLILTVKKISKNIALFKDGVCWVHCEQIRKFLSFLLSIGVSHKCIFSLLAYHYGDGTYGGVGNEVSFGELLVVNYEKQIEIVNEEFSNLDLLSKVIDYVLFFEKSGKCVDYFFIGDARRSIFTSKNVIKNNILNNKDNYHHKYMRIGVFNFSPLKRAIYFSEEVESKKHYCLLKINLSKYIKKQG